MKCVFKFGSLKIWESSSSGSSSLRMLFELSLAQLEFELNY
jgi:hypothetical protein